MKEVIKTIGKKLMLARLKAGLFQADVAEKIDTSTNYYSLVERGEKNPSAVIARAILNAVNEKLEAEGEPPLEWEDMFHVAAGGSTGRPRNAA